MKLYRAKVTETTEHTVLVWASSSNAAEHAIDNGEGDKYLLPGVQRTITEVKEETPTPC